MATLADFLHRFRRLGSPPGAPAAGLGVPEQPGATLAGELEWVFREVDRLEAEADQIGRAAEVEVAARQEQARDDAEEIRASAERQAERESRLEGARARAALDEEAAAIRAEAATTAAALAKHATQRRDELARVIAERIATTS